MKHLQLLVMSLLVTLTACTTLPQPAPSSNPNLFQRSGRLSISMLDTQQTQQLRFFIEKTAEQGVLQLSTSLGMGVAEVRWNNESLTVAANGKIQTYKNFAQMSEHLLGAAIELDEWMQWLRGEVDEFTQGGYHYKKQSETVQSLHFLVSSVDGRIKINALIQK